MVDEKDIKVGNIFIDDEGDFCYIYELRDSTYSERIKFIYNSTLEKLKDDIKKIPDEDWIDNNFCTVMISRLIDNSVKWELYKVIIKSWREELQ